MIDLNSASVKDSDALPDASIISCFNEMYDLTNKPVLAFITAKCGNTADIADIFQDTYMELYQRLKKRGTDYVTDSKAFVLKIAKNRRARHYSLAKRLQMFVSVSTTAKTGDGENGETEISGADIDSILAEDSMEDYAVNQIILEDLRQFIRQKPEDIKKIFYLFYDLGLSIPEIARKLSLGESNVKNKLYRTVKELKNLLEKGDNCNE
jgi:RNA polymerase sigma-70 factor (ECF subfamily)